MDLRLKFSSSFIVAGPSMSGKTTWVINLIKERDNIFDNPPVQVFWHYKEWSPQLVEIRQMATVKEGLPIVQDLVPNSMIIIDDLMIEGQNSEEMTNMFTKHVHHMNLILVNIVHNFYQKGEQRTRSLNTQYLVLFKNVRDASSIAVLARQMFPKNANYMISAYENATSMPYGYLFVDMRQETPKDLRLRTSIIF